MLVIPQNQPNRRQFHTLATLGFSGRVPDKDRICFSQKTYTPQRLRRSHKQRRDHQKTLCVVNLNKALPSTIAHSALGPRLVSVDLLNKRHVRRASLLILKSEWLAILENKTAQCRVLDADVVIGRAVAVKPRVDNVIPNHSRQRDIAGI